MRLGFNSYFELDCTKWKTNHGDTAPTALCLCLMGQKHIYLFGSDQHLDVFLNAL